MRRAKARSPSLLPPGQVPPLCSHQARSPPCSYQVRSPRSHQARSPLSAPTRSRPPVPTRPGPPLPRSHQVRYPRSHQVRSPLSHQVRSLCSHQARSHPPPLPPGQVPRLCSHQARTAPCDPTSTMRQAVAPSGPGHLPRGSTRPHMYCCSSPPSMPPTRSSCSEPARSASEVAQERFLELREGRPGSRRAVLGRTGSVWSSGSSDKITQVSSRGPRPAGSTAHSSILSPNVHHHAQSVDVLPLPQCHGLSRAGSVITALIEGCAGETALQMPRPPQNVCVTSQSKSLLRRDPPWNAWVTVLPQGPSGAQEARRRCGRRRLQAVSGKGFQQREALRPAAPPTPGPQPWTPSQ